MNESRSWLRRMFKNWQDTRKSRRGVTSGFPLLVRLSHPSKNRQIRDLKQWVDGQRKIRLELRPNERRPAEQEKLEEERRRSKRENRSDDAALFLSLFLFPVALSPRSSVMRNAWYNGTNVSNIPLIKKSILSITNRERISGINPTNFKNRDKQLLQFWSVYKTVCNFL